MLRVAVAGLVEAPLPAAEVAQCEPTVVRHLWAPAFLFHYEYFYHHEVDGVSDAWVLVDSGRHCHHCEDVVLPGWGNSGRTLITLPSSTTQCYRLLLGDTYLTHVRLWAES